MVIQGIPFRRQPPFSVFFRIEFMISIQICHFRLTFPRLSLSLVFSPSRPRGLLFPFSLSNRHPRLKLSSSITRNSSITSTPLCLFGGGAVSFHGLIIPNMYLSARASPLAPVSDRISIFHVAPVCYSSRLHRFVPHLATLYPRFFVSFPYVHYTFTSHFTFSLVVPLVFKPCLSTEYTVDSLIIHSPQ
ncbi:hypothetical protein EDB85DRAFT_370829 [Lactarius pseudohatsudake]|nr:hypothetical protein EDB85DRAFT_370829 [Lactarius pseudohatsudake]